MRDGFLATRSDGVCSRCSTVLLFGYKLTKDTRWVD